MTTHRTSVPARPRLDGRALLGTLLIVYGAILTVAGILRDADLASSGGTNAPLWVGLTLLVLGGVVQAWVKAVPHAADDDADG